jgi:hypothetical protein
MLVHNAPNLKQLGKKKKKQTQNKRLATQKQGFNAKSTFYQLSAMRSVKR